jgi:cell division protein FtsB
MAMFDDLRQRARQLTGPLIVAALVAYLGYHAVQGERGLVAWLRLSQQVEQTRAALALSRAEEYRLAHRVALLRPDGLDPDMLEERARAVLNLAHPNDLVIFTPPEAPKR